MISETIFKRIKEEYGEGEKLKQKELSKKFHVSQSQIQRILSGDRSADGFTVYTIDKMFPHAVIYLDGDKGITQTVSGTGNTAPAVVGDNNNFFTGDVGSESIAEKIKAAVMRSDLTPEAKVKVWEIIEAVKAENK